MQKGLHNLGKHTSWLYLVFILLWVPTAIRAQGPQQLNSCDLQDFAPTAPQTSSSPGGFGFYLANLPGELTPQYSWMGSPSITFFSDSTAHITGQVVNQLDNSRQWAVDMWLKDGVDYNTWTALGRDVKVEWAPQAAVDSNKQDWNFFEVDSLRSIVTGIPGTQYDGDTLYLSHNPPSRQFGFQMGVAANAKNGDFGISGWFLFSGSYTGHGDLNSTLSCGQSCEVELLAAIPTCLDDQSYEVSVSIGGSGNNYSIFDNLGNSLSGLTAGTYTFGPYNTSDTLVFTAKDDDLLFCEVSTRELYAFCDTGEVVLECPLSDWDTLPYSTGLYLVDIPGTTTPYFHWDYSGGMLTIYDDSTARITGRAYHIDNPNQQWDVNIWLIDQRDYAAWTALGRGVKVELAPPALVAANQQDWTFWEVDSMRSQVTGVPGTAFDGDTLFLSHNPPNRAVGFQYGVAANAKNGEYGISGWFLFTGDYTGHGDINAIAECGPDDCTLQLNSATASCIDNVSFSVDLDFAGSGNQYEISLLGGAVLDTVAAGAHTFGPFTSNQAIQLVIRDLDNPFCADTTALLLEDCSPLCDVAITNAVANCIDNVSFEVDLSFTGTGSNFEVSILGGAKLDTLSAGTYTFGPFVSTQGVQLVVTDLDMVDCADTTALLLEDCSLLCDVAIDTLFAQCVPSITTDSFQAVVGISGTTGPYRTIIEDIASQILLDTTLVSGIHTVGFYANSTQIRARVEDPDDPSCSAVSPLITADCTPVVDCDSMVIDSVWAVCVSNDSFEVFMAFQGQVTQPYRIQALQSVTFATVTLPGLSPGVYSLGRFVSGNGVSTFLAAENQTTCVKMGATVNLNCAGVFPPVNDSCANATPLNCGDVITGSFGGATNAGAPTARCAGVRPRGAGVWFSFQGDGNTITLSTCNSVPALNTQLFLYSGTCGSLTCEMANDDGTNCFGGTSELSFQTVVGTTYYIYLTDASTTGGDYTLEVGCTRSLQPNPVLISIGRTNLGNDLSWSMEEVGGLQGYVVERKLAGEDDFSEIAFVPAEGTIGDKVAYSHQDYDLHGEKVHTYRIRAEFRNDLPTFSEVKQVWVGILDRFHVGTLYPNPAEEVTHLEVQTDKAQPLQWKLYNMQGMELRSETIPLNKGEHTLDIDLQGLPQGSYRVVILGPEGPVHRTILVQ